MEITIDSFYTYISATGVIFLIIGLLLGYASGLAETRGNFIQKGKP